MSAYQLKTFADLYSAVLEELKIPATDTTQLQRIKRDINLIYQTEVIPYEQWKWLRGYACLQHEARFATGTATVTENSNTVTLTTAPATSRKGYWFSVDGQNDIYRIAQHAANSVTVTLETKYSGATSTTANFKIWTDKIPLPADCRETIQITHDYMNESIESLGLQKYRQFVVASPKAEGRPRWSTTSDYRDPDPYSLISGLPALSTRASSGLVKTLVFASSITSYLELGDRLEISGSGESSYNGQFIVGSVSGSTLTYTGRDELQESAVADASLSIKLLNNQGTDERYRELWIYPGIYTSRLQLHVDYIKEVASLENDADEPLMPIGDRVVLLYGALMRAWSRHRNPEEAQRNATLYDRKLQKMAGKIDDSTDFAILKPNKTYLAAKRNSQRTRTSRFLPLGDSGSGGASSTTIFGTANTIAAYDSSGELGPLSSLTYTATTLSSSLAIRVTSTTASTSTTTGCGIFAGGVGIAGNLYMGGAHFDQTKLVDGGEVDLDVTNSSDTPGSSARINAVVAGGSGGDPFFAATIAGVRSWMWGADNSDSDAFVITTSGFIGTTNLFKITTTGIVTVGESGGTQTHIANGDFRITGLLYTSNQTLTYISSTSTDIALNGNVRFSSPGGPQLSVTSSRCVLSSDLQLGGTSGAWLGNNLTDLLLHGGLSLSNQTGTSITSSATDIILNGNVRVSSPGGAQLSSDGSRLTISTVLRLSAHTASTVVGVDSNKDTTSLTYASANTASALVQRDGSGNFSAGTISATLTGTASGNTTYTANNHGVVISGSANAMTVIAPDASTTKVLVSGGASANPTWGTVAAGAMPALTGDVTTSAGAVATTVAKIQTVTVSGVSGTGNVIFSASPTFSGTVTLSSGTITSSAWDTGTSTFTSNGVAFTAKAPTASPTFTGTVTFPAGACGTTWGIGTGTGAAVDSSIILAVGGTGLATADQNGLVLAPSYRSTATGSAVALKIAATSQAASYTIPYYIGLFPQDITKGAGSAVTRSIMYYMVDPSAGTNNAVFSDNVSFSGNWFINYTGSQASTIGGAISVSGTTDSSSATTGILKVAGGVGIAKTVHIGGDTYIKSTLTGTARVIGEPTAVSVAAPDPSTNTIALGSGSSGLFLIQDNSSGINAVFLFANGATSTKIGGSAVFTAASGTGSSINITISGGTVTIQNKTGSALNIAMIGFQY